MDLQTFLAILTDKNSELDEQNKHIMDIMLNDKDVKDEEIDKEVESSDSYKKEFHSARLKVEQLYS